MTTAQALERALAVFDTDVSPGYTPGPFGSLMSVMGDGYGGSVARQYVIWAADYHGDLEVLKVALSLAMSEEAGQ